MTSQTRPITRTVRFWMLVLTSTVAGMTSGASTPVLPLYVQDVLHADEATSGAVIALASASAIVAMPVAGALGDRYGYRVIAGTGAVLAGISMCAMAAFPTLAVALLSRGIFGVGDAVVTSLLLAWAVATAPPGQRGEALGLYGLSVWFGLAAGTQLGLAVDDAFGPSAVFWACVLLELATLTLVLVLPAPRSPARAVAPPATRRRLGPRAALAAVTAVARPGGVAAIAWCAYGLFLSFLYVHLLASGLPSTGLASAGSVFIVFAASVITARLALAKLPDRIGPHRSAAIALCLLAAGLVVVALSTEFATAVCGAALIGIGFAPLFPALTMLAASSLAPHDQAFGLGVFSAFTVAGFGAGALVGGFLTAVSGTMWAFALVAALQSVGLALLLVGRRRASR